MLKATIIGLLVALFLRFGLLPLAWFFYEASHVLSIDWLYWGYSALRGADYVFSLYSLRTAVCVAVGLVVAGIVFWRSQRAQRVAYES